MRVVAPVVGLLTVAVTYVLGKEMLGRWAGLIASLLMAVSHWHIHESHTSFRAITLPLLVGLTFLLLWRALKSKGMIGYVLAGISGGVTMYTYQSSRVFPLLLALAFVYLWVSQGRTLPWRGVLVFAGVMAALTIPLGWYYVDHPGVFFSRIDQVGAGGMGIEESLFNALGMFSYEGDITWKFNLPGKPVFDPVISAFFYIGLAVCLWRWRRPAYGILLLWVAVMLTPTAFSTESPHFLRALGIMPAVYIIPAAGVLWLVEKTGPRLTALAGPRAINAGYAALAVWLAVGGVSTYRDYFGEWASSARAYQDYNGDVEDASAYLGTLDGSELVMFSTQYYGHYTVLFFERRGLELRWFDGRQSLPLPDEKTRDVVLVFPASTMPSRDLLDRILGKDSLASEGRSPHGQVSFLAYRLTPEQLTQARGRLSPPRPLAVTAGQEVELLGYQLGNSSAGGPAEVAPGGVLPLTLYWRVLQRTSADYSFFSHLLDVKGRMWGQGDTNQFWSLGWRPGDLVMGRYDLKIDPAAPPGRQVVEVGVFDRDSGGRLPVSGGKDSKALEAVKVKQLSTPDADNAGGTALFSFGDAIDLQGYTLEGERGSSALPREARPGESLAISFVWKASGSVNGDYTVFVHLVDASGRLVAQADAQPQGGAFPTSFWARGEVVADRLSLTVPAGAQPGPYTLTLGLYRLDTGARLPVASGGDEALLGRLDLVP